MEWITGIRRRTPNLKRLKFGSKYVFLAAFFAFSIYAANQIKLSHYFPIKKVAVFGVNHVDQHEVEALLVPLLSHGFFAVNVELIRDRLMQFPWVSNIFVSRSWPDKVEITIIEKVPVARWNEQSLLSEGGELFSPAAATYPAKLAIFLGPDGKQIEMLKNYREMNRILVPLHARISYLELSPYSTWKVTLDNGISLQIGHKDVLTRLEHFVKVYPKMIGSREGDVEYVDLRYSNGIAVRWKNTETSQ